MNQKISNIQLIFLVANFIFSSTVISLPQIIVQIAGQNGWLVPIIIFPVILLVLWIVFGKKSNIEPLKHLFIIGKKHNLFEKGFIFFFFIFGVLVLVRDMRGTVDFVATVLLPTTPIEMLEVLSILVIAYMATSGLEVIARINALFFGVLMVIVVLLPFLLLNEIQLANLLPLPSPSSFLSIIKAGYFSFSWMGELFLILIVTSAVNPIKAVKKSVMLGTALGVFLFCLILLLEVSVLGTKIVRLSTYPSFILIQQINLTDFLDRLDPVIVIVWLPAICAKITFIFYALNHCLSFLFKTDTNKFLFPIVLIFGYFSILMFKNNMDHLHFSFYTWSSLGLMLELMIAFLFFLVKRSAGKKKKDQEGHPAAEQGLTEHE